MHISSWSCDMEGHAKKCVERYSELANKTTQQLYKVSTPCIDDHHFKEEDLKSVGELFKKYALQLFWNAYILGTNWKTGYSMVSEQTCTIHHKMDQSLWQTIISFDLLHSSYMWLQTILSCGETLPNNANWDCLKTPILQEILRIQNLRQVEHCSFRKPYVCSNQLDVLETNFSFAQFNRIRIHFLGRRIEVGWYTRTWFMGSDRRSSWKHDSE